MKYVNGVDFTTAFLFVQCLELCLHLASSDRVFFQYPSICIFRSIWGRYLVCCRLPFKLCSHLFVGSYCESSSSLPLSRDGIRCSFTFLFLIAQSFKLYPHLLHISRYFRSLIVFWWCFNAWPRYNVNFFCLISFVLFLPKSSIFFSHLPHVVQSHSSILLDYD